MGFTPSGEQWTIKADGYEAVVVEVGGGVRALRLDGVEIIDEYAADELPPGSSGQILAPWPNRIRDGRYTFGGATHQLGLSEPARHTAIHGLVNWVRWSELESGPDRVVLGYDLPPQPGYPWPLRLRSEWSVSADGLRAAHEVTNLGDEPAPFGFSVHPYLKVPGVSGLDEVLLRVPGRSRLLTDARLLPIGAARVAGTEFDFTEPRVLGKLDLDTAFGDVVRGADGGSAVEMSSAAGARVRVWADEQFGWWQVYTSDSLGGERHRRAAAIEPMTCPPDAFRSGRDVITLEPGATWRGAWGVDARLAG
ncbi:aldose 1-epimerase family protein [Luedemannella flava]|uniref:Aldose 1-epimerase family protein n=1 Tax=Luedemannella flava TaxID=349316 RepID=A0ABP4XW52_9ACTN